MNNLKPMAESFFCRVRKSAFDTVEGCKDIVKGELPPPKSPTALLEEASYI